MNETNNPKYSKDEDARLKQLWTSGVRVQEIADTLLKEFGVMRTRNSVISRAHRSGLGKMFKRVKIPKLCEEQRERIVEVKRHNTCAEPGCNKPIERGSYCLAHSIIYYLPIKKKFP